jgi:hypothetical protein
MNKNMVGNKDKKMLTSRWSIQRKKQTKQHQ